jgi:hypothetical protein
VDLAWDPIASAGQPEYVISRDGHELGRTREPRWVDRHLKEGSVCRYSVAARAGDFTRFGEASRCEVTTPADRLAPVVTGVRVSPDGGRVRVAFNEPVDGKSACDPSGYRFEPVLHVRAVTPLGPDAVELSVEGWQSKTPYQLHVLGISDMAAARNRMLPGKPVAVGQFDTTVRYAMDALPGNERLEDASGGAGHAVLRGGAAIEAGVGPHGGPALVLDGRQGFAEGPNDLNLGPGDFTLAVWIYRENGGVIVSKGVDFGRPDQWSFGTSLRINNHYFSPAERAIRDRQWTHLAFTRQGNKGMSYVDGRPSGGPHDMSGIAPLVNDRLLRIGCREYEKNPVYFKGRISGLAIWPRALSPREIEEQASGRTSE